MLNLPNSIEPENSIVNGSTGHLSSLVLSKYGTLLVPPFSLSVGANTEYNEGAYTADPKPSVGDAKTFFLFGWELGVFGVFIEERFNTFSYVRSSFVLKS